MVDDLFRFTCQFARKGVFLCYSGPTTHDILVSTGNTLRHYLQTNNISKKQQFCIFSIYVELFENIIRYGIDCLPSNQDINSRRNPYGIISVSTDDNHFIIESGNIISSKQESKLRQYLSHINSMDQQTIKDFYREKRKSTCDPDCKGAGLGLIEIVKKSSTPIKFSFERIDDNFLFYILTAVI